MLSVRIDELGEEVILRCVGRIVKGTETAIMCAALRSQRRDVSVDLGRVEAIDAAGLGALISLQAAGIYLRLLNPSNAVLEVLRIARLDSIFEIAESREPSRAITISSSELLAAAGA